MVRLENISKSYGEVKALRGISVTFPKSEITIIAGADGAGKSSIFRIILGLEKADSGKVFVDENEVGKDFSKVTGISGFMPEKFSLYPDLTVEENLDFFAEINNVSYKRRENLKSRLLENTGMKDFRKRRAGDLSGGMKQKLSLSSILLSSPELVILDEPTTGVDPLSRIEFFKIIKSLKGEGKTIIISTPYLDEAENGDHIIFLKEGKIIKRGDIDVLKRSVPFKLWRILPEGNIFELMDKIKKRRGIKQNFFVKGKYINLITTRDESFLQGIDAVEISEQSPTLEDIYMFYEREEFGIAEQ